MSRLKPLQYPSRIEARYRRVLQGYVRDMRLDTRVLLSDPRWRQDALADDMTALVDSLRQRFRGLWPENRIAAAAREIFQRTNEYNYRRFTTQWREAIPIVQPISDLDLAAPFVRENVALIKSIDGRYFDEIERLVMDTIRTGRRVEVLRKNIEERYGVSRSRANLLARDQVGKLVGQMTKARQLEAGIEQVEWSASMDERVRKSHRQADGKVFDLKKGLLVDGVLTWPGQPVLCRCSSVPVLD